MGRVATLFGRAVAANNRVVARADPETSNPRDADRLEWHRRLAASTPRIAAEWSAFADAGGRLPRIEDVLGEGQGNEGPWRMGLLVDHGRTTELARRHFPATVAALAGIPGLAAALWSVLEPGTELGAHRGPNAGVLRYHLGIDCPDGAALRVGDVVVPYRDGEGVLFDDTAVHEAWNHGDRPRVTLFCEVVRPLPPVAAGRNRALQFALSRDPRRRAGVVRADEWYAALNP